MNLILKIVQGPNTGAEIALIEGVNVKLGKSDECDIVLADQALPEVACEIEVGSERVMLLLPGGGQERLEPLHVRKFETTAIAVGPADTPWGELVWPEPEAEPAEAPKQEEPVEKEKPQPQRKASRLYIILIVVVALFILLEFLLWLFWPQISKLREHSQSSCGSGKKGKSNDESQLMQAKSIEELAAAYKVAVLPNGEDGKLLKGNLEKCVDRLRLTAEAYSIMPGITIDLSDDETLKRSSTELIDMLTEGALRVVNAKNRELTLAGRLKDISEMERVLEAIKNDVKHIDKIDCSQVEIIPQVTDNQVHVIAVAKRDDSEHKKAETVAAEAAEAKSEGVAITVPEIVVEPTVEVTPVMKVTQPSLDSLPIVGVVTTPYPYLVFRNGSRVVEGAEFNGYVISKIGEDVILLRKGDETLEWRP